MPIGGLFMRFFAWMEEVFAGAGVLAAALGIAAVVLLIVAAVAFWVQTTGAYAAAFAVIFGGFGVAVAFGKADGRAAWVGVSLLLAFGGIVYLLLFAALTARKAILMRKEARAQVEKRLQYTLPQRENGYLRERLNTALRVQDGEGNGRQMRLRLGYARALLYKVQSAPLTVAERLQVKEMHAAFALYRGKEVWTAEELCCVNELCAALLKLSAKYTV